MLLDTAHFNEGVQPVFALGLQQGENQGQPGNEDAAADLFFKAIEDDSVSHIMSSWNNDDGHHLVLSLPTASDCQFLLMLSQITHNVFLKELLLLAQDALIAMALSALSAQALPNNSNDGVNGNHLDPLPPGHLAAFLAQDCKEQWQKIRAIIDSHGAGRRNRVNLFQLPKPYADACKKV